MITPEFLDDWQEDTRARFDLRMFSVSLVNADIRLGVIAVQRGYEGRGVGSDALRALCGLADEYGYRIVLTASSDRLTRFYERFGFVQNTGPNRDRQLRCRMHREPGQPHHALNSMASSRSVKMKLS